MSTATLEWQAFGMSPLAHLIDTARPNPKRSGPRAECGRYPGRQFFPWWAIAVAEVEGKPLSHGLRRCSECVHKVGDS